MEEGDIYVSMVNSIKNVKKMAKIIYINFLNRSDEKYLDYSYFNIKDMLIDRRLLGMYLIMKPKVIGYMFGRKIGMRDGRYVYVIEYFYVEKEDTNNYLKYLMLKKIINYLEDIGINTIIILVEKGGVIHRLLLMVGFKKDVILKSLNDKYVYMCYKK